jgi:hypothetical protein
VVLVCCAVSVTAKFSRQGLIDRTMVAHSGAQAPRGVALAVQFYLAVVGVLPWPQPWPRNCHALYYQFF